jgi:SAM-dependent methyltransferase
VSSPPDDLKRFYAEGYSAAPGEADRLGGWRALGARAKADHVAQLCARAGVEPQRIVEIGCGDGALLAELAARDFAPSLAGFELSEEAVALARAREIPGLERVDAFDGERLPVGVGDYDLGVISHVLEHVPKPAALLAEAGRACAAVIVEVPLEANVSARRAAKRSGAAEIGHLHSFDRDAVHMFVRAAGLAVAGELADPLSFRAHAYFARGAAGRARALVKAAVRRAVFTAAPRKAERVFTVHYACLCVPPPKGE